MGQNLAGLLVEQGGTLPPEEAAVIMRQCLRALAYAHERGILHRDIKPENIMIMGNGRVKITDFGLALVRGDARLTQENALMGTILYLAPECFMDQPVDARSDLYALGAVWYELLTGRPPFGDDSLTVTLGQIINDTAVPPSQRNDAIPPALDALIINLLAKEPDSRYQTAEEVIAAMEQLDRVPLPPAVLHVSLLGEFLLRYGETAVPPLDTRCQLLLAYLILHRDVSHTRQQLAFQFWPDSSEAQARTNLRKIIYKLRHTLPEADQFLCLDKQTIQWRPDAPFTLDVAEFEQFSQTESRELVELNRQPPTVQLSAHDEVSHLQKAITLYRGDLLPGHYDDWLLADREQLRQKYLTCLEQLILHLENERQYQAAIDYGRRLLREDPLHEAAYRRLMRLQALDGNVAGALRVYHDCVTTLQRELGVSPSQATQETYERLLKLDAPREIAAPVRTPLVAREQSWTTLQTAWRQVSAAQPGVVLLSGEAGIGKTRLAEELLDWSRRQGVTTLTAACYAAEGQLPYAPVADWLRAADLQSALAELEDRWLIECARLRPDLLTRRPDLTPPTPLQEGWQRQHFFTAVTHAILRARQPLLLFIDDLQWCDQDTLAWLHFLLRFDKQARFLLLGTVRVEEVTDGHPLIEWQQHLHRAGSLTEIPLARLDAVATGQLAAHIARHTLDPDLAARVYAETEGNPLFVVETARAGFAVAAANLQPPATHTSAGSVHVLPPKVQAVIETRLSLLSPSARELTNLAATIGRSFTFDLLAAASGEGEETAVRGLDELWQRHIVRERGLDAYDFSHDKIRQVAYAGLSSARRRLLHGRIVQALTALHQDNLDEVHGQMAAHHEAAGQFAAAASHYQQAGMVAQRIFAHQETVYFLERAIALLPQIKDDGLSAQLYEQLGDVLTLIKRYEEAQKSYATAVSQNQMPISQARIHGKIGHTWNAQQQYEPARQAYDTALKLLGAATPDTEWQRTWLDIQLERADMFYFQANLTELASLIAAMKGPIDQYGANKQKVIYLQTTNMLQFRLKRFCLDETEAAVALASLELAEQSGDAHGTAVEMFGLGFVRLFSGQIEAGIERLTAALRRAEQNGNIYLQDQCIAYLSIGRRFQGDTTRVAELAQRGLAISELAQNVFYKGVAEANLAWISYREGRFDEAFARGESAMARWHGLPYPLRWLALWPLLATAVHRHNIENALTYAQAMLHPVQQKLPEGVTAVLQQAITAGEANQLDSAQIYLQKSIHLAQEAGYL